MNDTLKTLLNHRSIRKFKDEPLSQEHITSIIKSAQMASTSSFIQAYTIIGVTDKAIKSQLAHLSGPQPYVEQNGHFFVFCADLYRHTIAGTMEKTAVTTSLESTEKFMVAVIDASLAAQNATIAAESMGYGICYIGGLRNDMKKVSELLSLPDYVIPLFGLAVGIPDTQTDQKPRLPMESIYYENTYPKDTDTIYSGLESYNDTITNYYESRTQGERKDRWTEQISHMLSKPKRTDMKDVVQQKGFLRD
ncbi:oxygen-insensitive NADPH nitroreductase [Salipaludibacillus agaradhaerens]|uniref:Oxygen-insensitive NADPH nitroreductase n=1 Tax=Salipaludibacillus agaradhaerens TaxID=76935 RepID=A0A9Q4B0N4_SALAG|nr:oxygen-insensitive NADPH nitroreductase [Salipaludibacillus agaradhaerens]MCR6095862.1 oxygen-insensitive NADPH nitroreductase [Salipaludibacillus agaradhaerens]MCR6114579.1 oxygen-insensitive NADPH nitroreductase [Salipaludibacillus agaradhaerens]